MRPPKLCILIVVILLFSQAVNGQDATSIDKLLSSPGRLFAKFKKKPDKIEANLSKQTERYLHRLEKKEQSLRKQLQKTDSTKAQMLFGTSNTQLAAIADRLNNSPVTGSRSTSQYSGHLDSMQTVLAFLHDSTQQTSINPGNGASELIKSYKSLQSRLNQTGEIRKYLDDRKQYLRDQLQNTPLVKQFQSYQKEIYYYKAQMESYKAQLESPERLEADLLKAVNRIPSFKAFFAKYSQLAGLFPPPDNYGSIQAVAGLQSRSQIQEMIQGQIAAGGPNAQSVIQNNLADAQSQFNQLKERLMKFGNSSADMDMPDFRPHAQRTKSFLKRLEYGFNTQAQKSGFFFPATTDIAVSVGYKMDEKSSVGIGGSYKIGLGKDINHIRLSHQGVGLRSYLDIRMKKGIYVSGGFEYNYQQPFSSLRQINKLDSWQQSALIGISKIVSIKAKFFKKTKLQFLWDFLSYRQSPVAQPFKFRVGYIF